MKKCLILSSRSFYVFGGNIRYRVILHYSSLKCNLSHRSDASIGKAFK